MGKYEIVKSSEFCGVECDFYSNENNDLFMTAFQLGSCLGYSTARESINKIVERNKYLKDIEFSAEVNLTSPSGTQKTRLFTEDGIYEVTMLSKTKKAKEFRAFVRKIIKSIRKGESVLVSSNALEEMKIKAQADRATAMKMNAENRRLKLLLSNPNWQGISDVALQTMGIKTVESITGQNLGNLLPECEKTYSATEIGNAFGGIAPQTIGRKANSLGIKNEKYGIWVMDKSPYCTKEVKSFRYNLNGVKALADAFNVENYSLA